MTVGRGLALVMAAALVAPPVAAQVILEVQPFIGYRFGGNLHPGGNAPDLPSLDFRNSRSEGISVALDTTEGRGLVGLEFMWNRQPTRAVPAAGGSPVPLCIDQYLIHATAGAARGEKLRRPLPFGFFGGAATRIPPFDMRYAYSFGGGIRYFFTRRFGLRIQGRFTPIHLYDGPETYTPYGGPHSGERVSREHYTNQGEFTVGVDICIPLWRKR
jgi:hypothetical protein